MKLTKDNIATKIHWLTEGEMDLLKVPEHVRKSKIDSYVHQYEKGKADLGICGEFLVIRDKLIVVPFEVFTGIMEIK